MDESTELPPTPQAAPTSPTLERRGWLTGIAPNYIGLFLWVVYFDQLGRRTLAMGGLGWSVLGAAAAGLLCYALLYYVPAMWGLKTGQPLAVVASSTFGVTGAAWVTNVAMGLAQVVWFAVGTFYATDLTFKGLIVCDLLDPQYHQTLMLGGLTLMGPLFLVTSLTWSYATALVGRYFVRIIAALMNFIPAIPALMLALATGLTLSGAGAFRPPAIDPATSAPVTYGGPRAVALMIQLIFGFFAIAGLAAADWGAVTRTARDVRLGGWVSVACASWVVATLALLTVAGAFGRVSGPPAHGPGVGSLTVQSALIRGIGGPPAAVMFLIFGLGSLAPAVYASFLFGHRFVAVWPKWSRLHATLAGTTAAWLLIATGWPSRLEAIFSILGAVFAPVAGALAADYVRSRGHWPGPRRGVNPAGLVAWLAGMAVGLVPTISAACGWSEGLALQPAALGAFLTGFLADTLLARFGVEPPTLPIPEPAPSLATP